MKVAVIGDGPFALSQALKIEEIGGTSIWFDTNPNAFDYLSTLTANSTKNLSELKNERARLISDKRYYNEQLIRVTKRFLFPNEQIKNHSRFNDLFRVVINKKTSENLLKEGMKVSPEILSSLKEELEIYFDFDVVLDCSSGIHPYQYLCEKSPAIGELALQKNPQLVYGYDILNQEFKEALEVAVVGANPLTIDFLLQNTEMIKDSNKLLFWVAHQEDPVAELMSIASDEQKNKLADLFESMERDYQEAKDLYQTKYQEWQLLEDYMKAKIAEPAYPIPGIVIFAGHTTTIINKLVDQDKLFLSIEKPEFREAKQQKENSDLASKTLSLDRVYIASQFSRNTAIYNSLNISDRPGLQEEPGMFFCSHLGESGDLDVDSNSFFTSLLKWFSPKETH